MNRYKFRLDQVRNVRRVQEDQALAAFLRAQRAAADAADAAANRRTRYDAESRVTPSGSTGLFVADHERLAWGAAAVEAASQALADARWAAGELRTEWSETARRVAALDRLDERLRAEHAVEAQRAFERQVDDIVVARGRARD